MLVKREIQTISKILWLCGMLLCSYVVEAHTFHKPNLTKVEKKFLDMSGRKVIYEHERIPIIEVRDQVELGKLTALRFIEWISNNPDGVVGLCSGNTPEYFIKFLAYYKRNWHVPAVQQELEMLGIKSKKFPSTENLRLVQLEELYPIAPNHTKKVSNYTLRNYVTILGIKPKNLLLIDIEQRGILAEKGINVVFNNGAVDVTILDRTATSQVDRWQQRALKELQNYCRDYEKKIRLWGGIDFFIGSLTYNGYFLFNEPGGALDSRTHFVPLNYTTAASVAQSLGGIEYARGKLAITIGLGTITYKPDAVKIVIASDVSNSKSIANALQQEVDIRYPASVLQKFKNSRFYITNNIATNLKSRYLEDLQKISHPWSLSNISKVLIEIAKRTNKPIMSLTLQDVLEDPAGKVMLSVHTLDLEVLKTAVHDKLAKNIEDGLEYAADRVEWVEPKKVIHTAPHHEDMILSCYPIFDSFQHHINHFIYFTSGYNSVTNHYVLTTISRASDWWLNKYEDWIFDKSSYSLLNKFKSFYQKKNIQQLENIETIFTLRCLAAVYNISDVQSLKNKIRWLKDDYFPNQKPGDIDGYEMCIVKGMLRELEAERQLALQNTPIANITHLRSKFYSGHEFKRTPRYVEDILPFLQLVKNISPDMITVLDEPHSSTPSTNYRVLQIISAVLKANKIISKNIIILGYRNPWIRYNAHEANIYIPISKSMLTEQNMVFNSCFNTQKMSSFPIPSFEGGFINLAERVQKETLNELKLLLGDEFFINHKNHLVRNAKGFIYLRAMPKDELFRSVSDLLPDIDLEEIR